MIPPRNPTMPLEKRGSDGTRARCRFKAPGRLGGGGGGDSLNLKAGVCRWNSETLTLYQNVQLHFAALF